MRPRVDAGWRRSSGSLDVRSRLLVNNETQKHDAMLCERVQSVSPPAGLSVSLQHPNRNDFHKHTNTGGDAPPQRDSGIQTLAPILTPHWFRVSPVLACVLNVSACAFQKAGRRFITPLAADTPGTGQRPYEMHPTPH